MPDHDLIDSPELNELRDAVSGVEVPGRPGLDAIAARGRARRRRRRSGVARASALGAVAAAAVAVTLTSGHSQRPTLGTIKTAAYTLHHNQNGTDTLTLNPVELFDSAQLQSDLAQYGIPAKVTTGSYCRSDPEPAGFPQVVASGGSGPGTSVNGGPVQKPSLTIDPSAVRSGAELSVGNFKLPSGELEAEMSLINSNSFNCTSTPPDLNQPDSSNGDLGLLYGGNGRS